MMIRWAPQQPQGNSVSRQRILDPPMFPELRELDPRSSWLSSGPRRRRVRIGVFGVLLLGIQPFDDFGHEEQLLIGRGCIPLATLAEHRPLKEPQLLGGLRQLLLVCGDDFLLLGDDRLLVARPSAPAHESVADRPPVDRQEMDFRVPCPIKRSTPRFGSAGIEDFFRMRHESAVMHAAIADDAAHWPSRCLPGSASNRSAASRFRRAKPSHPPAQPAPLSELQRSRFQAACTK